MLKRIFDIIAAFSALIILSPLFVSVTLLVSIKLGKPVIFKQVRPGLNEKAFILMKFRTMTDATDESGELLPDSERITKFGRFLRKTSLDELPELINILKGEMSFVGPRPLLMSYLPYYTDEERRRHDVLPGLTGLAQVSGRNALSWEEKLKLDLEYVDKQSFLLDLKIILITFIKVFKKENILDAAPQGAFDKYRKHQKKEKNEI